MPLDERPTSWPADMRARRVLGVLATFTIVALMATAAFWSQRTTGLTDDGPGFLLTVTVARRWIEYHHVGYLELARAAARLFFDGATLDALLMVSATCGGLSLAAMVVLARTEGRRGDGALVGAALAASPALWIHSTYVELHSAQLLGSVGLLAAATFATGRRSMWRALLLCLATAAALPMHATNLLLVPGAVWIAARRGRGSSGVERGPLIAAALGAALGVVLGVRFNTASRGTGAAASLNDASVLLTRFFAGPSLAFMSDELLALWFPVLGTVVVLLLAGRNSLRAAWPFLAAGLPALVFFAFFGVPTRGGYFTSALAALLLGAAATGSPNATRPRAALRLPVIGVLVLLWCFGALRTHGALTSSERVALEQLSSERFTTVTRLLPHGGWLVGIQPSRQSATGRIPGLLDIELTESLIAAITSKTPPADFAMRYDEVIVEAASDDVDLVVDQAWRELVPAAPELEALMLALIARIEVSFETSPLVLDGHDYLVCTPRARA